MSAKAATAKATDVEVLPTIKDVLAGLNKKMGAGTIFQLGTGPSIRATSIATQSVGLNLALGVGGMPRGRIVEIYGKEHSGKTGIALGIVANAQKLAKIMNSGRKCAYIDPECGLVLENAQLIGVDTDDLIYAQPECGEDALDIAEALIRSNMFDVIVVDSVAALVPRKELEGNMDDQSIGLQARLMSKACRKLTVLTAKTGTILIFINQLREKVGVIYGSPETTPGGNALKFYASVRLDVRRGESIMQGKEQVGHNVNVKVVKNRVAPPHKKCAFGVIYTEGVDLAQELCAYGPDMGIFKKGGSWYTLLDETGAPVMDDKKEVKWNGVNDLRNALNDDPDLKNEILSAFQTKIQEQIAAIPTVDDDISGELTEEDHDKMSDLTDETALTGTVETSDDSENLGF